MPGSGPRSGLAALTLALLLTGAPILSAAELRPLLLGGYAHIVDAHGAIGAAARVEFGRRLFLQAEYLALLASGHTDHGPAFQVGVSSANVTGLRPYLALGGGPVKGFAGDDGLYFGALGASYPLGSGKVFVQPEVRFGILGESGYTQVAVGIVFAP